MGISENKVFINSEGVIEIHVIGDQTKESVATMGKKAKLLLQGHGAKQLVLDDITRMGKTDIPARNEVSRLAKALPFDRIALVGDGSITMRVGTNLMLSAIGMGRKIRYFESRERAMLWLLGG